MRSVALLVLVAAFSVAASDAAESVVSLEGEAPRWGRGADDAYDAGGEGDDGDSRDTMGDSAEEQEDEADGAGLEKAKTLSGRFRSKMQKASKKAASTVASANKGIAQLKATLKKSRQNDVIAKVLRPFAIHPLPVLTHLPCTIGEQRQTRRADERAAPAYDQERYEEHQGEGKADHRAGHEG